MWNFFEMMVSSLWIIEFGLTIFFSFFEIPFFPIYHHWYSITRKSSWKNVIFNVNFAVTHTNYLKKRRWEAEIKTLEHIFERDKRKRKLSDTNEILFKNNIFILKKLLFISLHNFHHRCGNLWYLNQFFA